RTQPRWYDRESYSNVPIVQRPRTWPFQGQNTGSNPVGDESLALARLHPPTLFGKRGASLRAATAVPNPVGDVSPIGQRFPEKNQSRRSVARISYAGFRPRP